MTDPAPEREYRAQLMAYLASDSETERVYADVFLTASARARANVITNTESWTEVDEHYPWFGGVVELIVDMTVRDTIAVLSEKGLLRG